MLLSNSNNNGGDPVSVFDHSFFQRSLLDEEDHLHLPISSFPFPSPFEDDDVFLPPHQELFLHHLHQCLFKPTESTTNSIPKTSDSLPNKNHKVTQTSLKGKQIQRRRTSKKDRHSKINTLRGPRDRRMRLSLPVARDLFGLQDMLGVDKASKTVEWLLIQSEPAINKLKKELNGSETKSSSSLSDGEVVSGIDEDHAIEANQQVVEKEKKKVRIKHSRKLSFHPSKESRETARARARARTEKKKQSRRLITIIDDDRNRHTGKSSHDLIRTCSSLSPETGNESAGTQSNSMNPCLDIPAEIDKPTSSHSIAQKLDQMIDDSSMITNNWSPSSIFSSLHYNGISPKEDQFEEFPLIAKSWNFYDTHTLC